jgi:dTDP-4-dehydrorhamnose 3,5-epimerase-like enzyme
MKTTVSDCKLISLSTIYREEGLMTIAEQDKEIPFAVKRIYYIYDVPDGSLRGFHAHKKINQLIIAIHGSFTINMDDGKEHKIFKLRDPQKGLLIPSGLWRILYNFSSDAVCLVLASEKYDEKDYIREYSTFLKFKKWK